MKVTFDKSARDFVLDAFGKEIRDGFLAEKSKAGKPGERVLTPRGEEIPESKFAGIRKGSTVFVKSDIVSLIEAAESMK